MTQEDIIINSIEEDLRLQKGSGRLAMSGLGNEWTRQMLTEPRRFMTGDIHIDRPAIRNFRRKQIFVMDLPIGRQGLLNPLNIIDGGRRGHARMLKELLKTLEDYNFGDILKKYPCSTVGNPNIFQGRGYAFTFMWIKHIYSLGLFTRYIKPELGEPLPFWIWGAAAAYFPAY